MELKTLGAAFGAAEGKGIRDNFSVWGFSGEQSGDQV